MAMRMGMGLGVVKAFRVWAEKGLIGSNSRNRRKLSSFPF